MSCTELEHQYGNCPSQHVLAGGGGALYQRGRETLGTAAGVKFLQAYLLIDDKLSQLIRSDISTINPL